MSVVVRVDDQHYDVYLYLSILRYCFEVGTLLSTLAFMLFQLGEEIKNAGLMSFWRNLVSLVEYILS